MFFFTLFFLSVPQTRNTNAFGSKRRRRQSGEVGTSETSVHTSTTSTVLLLQVNYFFISVKLIGFAFVDIRD